MRWPLIHRKTSYSLSPEMRKVWSFVDPKYLIMATESFIVWIDDDLDVDWKTKANWDESKRTDFGKNASILNRAASLESGDWSDATPNEILHLKRQVGEAIARFLDGQYMQADQMLTLVNTYRDELIQRVRRRKAIQEQVTLKRAWKGARDRWMMTHYLLGGFALALSSLVAAKPELLRIDDAMVGFLAWLVALLTGFLTFLAPDKKADRYARAWSILNRQIARYEADTTYTLDHVLEACRQGESILFDGVFDASRLSR